MATSDSEKLLFTCPFPTHKDKANNLVVREYDGYQDCFENRFKPPLVLLGMENTNTTQTRTRHGTQEGYLKQQVSNYYCRPSLSSHQQHCPLFANLKTAKQMVVVGK